MKQWAAPPAAGSANICQAPTSAFNSAVSILVFKPLEDSKVMAGQCYSAFGGLSKTFSKSRRSNMAHHAPVPRVFWVRHVSLPRYLALIVLPYAPIRGVTRVSAVPTVFARVHPKSSSR